MWLVGESGILPAAGRLSASRIQKEFGVGEGVDRGEMEGEIFKTLGTGGPSNGKLQAGGSGGIHEAGSERGIKIRDRSPDHAGNEGGMSGIGVDLPNRSYESK